MAEQLAEVPTPSALATPRFTAFFIAASISNAAGWMQTVAIPALLFSMTGKSTWLGLSVVVNIGPAVLLAAPAGVLSDRMNRRVILLATQIAQLLSASLLWWLYHIDALTPGRILAVGLIGGVATGFQSPTWQAFIPSLVPASAMLDAVRLNTLQFTLARAAGPAIAGVVVRNWGIGWAVWINAVTYLLPVVVLAVIRTPPNATDSLADSPLAALRDGAVFVWRERGLRMVVTLSLITATLGQSFQFIAAAVTERMLGHPPTDNAQLLTGLGVGGLFIATFGRRLAENSQRRPATMAAVLVMYTVTPTILALTDVFFIGIIAYFVAGMAHVLNAVTANAYIQSHAPDGLRGRVMSFYLLAILAGIQIGSFVLGWLGDVLGMRTTVALNAAVTALTAAWMIRRGVLGVLGDRSAPASSATPVPIEQTTTTQETH